MHGQLGIEFLWKNRVTKCDAHEYGDITLEFDTGGRLCVNAVLVAAGRASNTAELNLAAAGLEPGARGLLTVDAQYRTAVPHIYAAGDVIGFPALASTSMEQARVAMCHAFNKGHKTDLAPILPTGIYTIPEVSMVGTTEEDLKSKGVDYIVGRASYAHCARGEIIGDQAGFLKLLYRREDMKLLGVHVIGEQATEVVHVGVVAMLADGTAELFNRSCFNFPTLGDLYKIATYNAYQKATRPGPAPAPRRPPRRERVGRGCGKFPWRHLCGLVKIGKALFPRETLAMESTPKMSRQEFIDRMRQKMEEALGRVADAINEAPPGQIIADSEERVRDTFADLRRDAYEMAMQMRLDAAEAAFPPSEGPGHRPDQAQ